MVVSSGFVYLVYLPSAELGSSLYRPPGVGEAWSPSFVHRTPSYEGETWRHITLKHTDMLQAVLSASVQTKESFAASRPSSSPQSFGVGVLLVWHRCRLCIIIIQNVHGFHNLVLNRLFKCVLFKSRNFNNFTGFLASGKLSKLLICASVPIYIGSMGNRVHIEGQPRRKEGR